MKFVDSVKIDVRAGAGGNGCMSFRREKFVPRGGPDGGNGGRGGNVVLEGDDSRHTLLDLSYRAQYQAERGIHGKGKDMNGRAGEDLIIKVPVGTLVYDVETNDLVADVTQKGEQVIVAKGGRGGRGNTAFVSPTHRAPRQCEPGNDGEKRLLRLELKLIADVGIIGMPNAGKSTFISTVSAARPKVADYPFTTLVPSLGVVKSDYGEPFVLADMPGLIEGAHEGVGLGTRFLRHIERTRVLLHFVDASDEVSMKERYDTIQNELSRYGKGIADKRKLVAATKIDSAHPENLEEFEAYMDELGIKLFKVSSVAGNGVKELTDAIAGIIKETGRAEELENEESL
ncbi:GTPase ObgE [Limisalsivibrio acetivorans]|uniref:GTPase ObgE n=1 Tax=Limisalsivibrio acetivorans TaxID=1304888 RepID=UPI0003B7B76E|nr:GTPase ObgE [Limisalsivibrio acetivorans]